MHVHPEWIKEFEIIHCLPLDVFLLGEDMKPTASLARDELLPEQQQQLTGRGPYQNSLYLHCQLHNPTLLEVPALQWMQTSYWMTFLPPNC